MSSEQEIHNRAKEKQQSALIELELAFNEAKEIASGKRKGFTIEEIIADCENSRFGNGHKN